MLQPRVLHVVLTVARLVLVHHMKPSAKKLNFGAKSRVFAVKPGPVLLRLHQRNENFFGISLDILQNTKNKFFPEKSCFFLKKNGSAVKILDFCSTMAKVNEN